MVPKNIAADWISLWREFEKGTSNEAVVVKQLDKFDMIAQAFQYEQKYNIGISAAKWVNYLFKWKIQGFLVFLEHIGVNIKNFLF